MIQPTYSQEDITKGKETYILRKLPRRKSKYILSKVDKSYETATIDNNEKVNGRNKA